MKHDLVWQSIGDSFQSKRSTFVPILQVSALESVCLLETRNCYVLSWENHILPRHRGDGLPIEAIRFCYSFKDIIQ